MKTSGQKIRRPQHGLTLIELMVAMLIGMFLSLAVFAVMSTQEGRKRTTTSVNDINQAGNYASYVLDGWVRSAGSGFVQSAGYAFGCSLHAAKSGTTILPRPAALPAPFAGINTDGVFRLIPVLILPSATTPDISGAGSDALIVMGGAAGKGEIASLFTAFPTTTTSLALRNTLSFGGNDLALLADQQAPGGKVPPCLVSQVQSGFTGGTATSLPLAGAYYTAAVSTTKVDGYTIDGVVLNLGNVANNNPPSFQVIGVGAKNTLFAYDLLQTTDAPLQAVADGVFELHALYGVDSDSDGKVDTWVTPTASSGNYSVATLTAGTPEAASRLQQIRAVRVGLITRTSLPEKSDVAPASLTLFGDLASSLQHTRTFSSDEKKYRYRAVEINVPLRNAMTLEQ